MTKIKTLKLSALAMCCMLFTQISFAGLFDDGEARANIDKLSTRVQTLEDASRAQLELNNQIELLKEDVAKLRGQVELLGNEIEQTQKRQKDFYIDLDNRLRKIESNNAPAATDNVPAQTGTNPVVDKQKEAQDYDAAVNMLRGGKYADSAIAFKSFIKNYPQSTSLPNAYFWAASSYSQLRDVRTAQDYYSKVVTHWPNSTLAPDALLGVANSQQARNDKKGSRESLETLVNKYPNSEAAKTARQRLSIN